MTIESTKEQVTWIIDPVPLKRERMIELYESLPEDQKRSIAIETINPFHIPNKCWKGWNHMLKIETTNRPELRG